jgi:hypothetical protein
MCRAYASTLAYAWNSHMEEAPQPTRKPKSVRSLFDDANSAGPLPQSPKDFESPVKDTGGITSSARRPKLVTRVLLPAIILIVGIAGIAWIAQNLPGRGRTLQVVKSGDAVQFEPATFAWDPKDPKYVRDFELGESGYYDYQFINNYDGDVDLGVSYVSCTCSGVSVCVFRDSSDHDAYLQNKEGRQLPWTKLEVDKDFRDKTSVPAKASGVLRIAWKGKYEAELVRLSTKVWTRAGHGQDTRSKELVVLANYVYPVRFFPDAQRLDLGIINPNEQQSGSFYCWSETRDLDVVPTDEDKLVKVVTEKLGAEQRALLTQRMLSSKTTARIRSATKVTVTLYEESDGRQLDMGLFLRPAPVTITSNGQPVDVPLPLLKAFVHGDVSLGPENEGGRIDLGVFSAKTGITKRVTLLAPPDADVTFVGCEPVLLDTDVELKKLALVGGKAQWQLIVTAKSNRDPGLLPENGVLILRCDMPATQIRPATTRLARIPVIGTAENRR